jgi:hypothetical protein
MDEKSLSGANPRTCTCEWVGDLQRVPENGDEVPDLRERDFVGAAILAKESRFYEFTPCHFLAAGRFPA